MMDVMKARPPLLACTGEKLSDLNENPRRRESRFWRSAWVKWWIQGHGRDGYSFRLLLVPLIGIFVLVFILQMLDMIASAVLLSGVMTIFLGVAGFYGAKRECLVASPATRAVLKARMKQAAERFASLGVGATVLAIFVNATSVSLALYGLPVLDSALKDALSVFIALVFLPVYVSGAVRKLAIARIEELEALRGSAIGEALRCNRRGDVRAVVVKGPAGHARVSAREYEILGFEPRLGEMRCG